MKTIRVLLVCLFALATGGWGVRGHSNANRAAVKSIPADGPLFLKAHEDWIAGTGIIPDSWRGNGEQYSKLFEDPNHGWFKEQFAFLSAIPRSRYEFVIRLHDEYLRLREKDPERAALTNVRWAGTLPYAAMENYDRIKSSMRLYRRAVAANTAESQTEATYLARDIAFYVAWLGHYTADGAMPLHTSIHHDGWKGPNPKAYTTDGRIHGRFESSFVDLVKITDADLLPLMSKPKLIDDPFVSILAHLDDSYRHMEEVYVLDKAGAFTDASNAQANQLAKGQLAKAAALLRDLTYTAWIESGKPVPASNAESNPVSRSNPNFNPETGTAPPGPAVKR